MVFWTGFKKFVEEFIITPNLHRYPVFQVLNLDQLNKDTIRPTVQKLSAILAKYEEEFGGDQTATQEKKEAFRDFVSSLNSSADIPLFHFALTRDDIILRGQSINIKNLYKKLKEVSKGLPKKDIEGLIDILVSNYESPSPGHQDAEPVWGEQLLKARSKSVTCLLNIHSSKSSEMEKDRHSSNSPTDQDINEASTSRSRGTEKISTIPAQNTASIAVFQTASEENLTNLPPPPSDYLQPIVHNLQEQEKDQKIIDMDKMLENLQKQLSVSEQRRKFDRKEHLRKEEEVTHLTKQNEQNFKLIEEMKQQLEQLKQHLKPPASAIPTSQQTETNASPSYTPPITSNFAGQANPQPYAIPVFNPWMPPPSVQMPFIPANQTFPMMTAHAQNVFAPPMMQPYVRSIPGSAPPTFTGDEATDGYEVTDFIRRFNSYQTRFPTGPEDAIATLEDALKGKAAQWYEWYRTSTVADGTLTTTLKALETQYSKNVVQEERYEVMKARKQKKEEDFQTYSSEKLKLIKKWNTSATAQDTCYQLWWGMEPKLASKMKDVSRDDVSYFIWRANQITGQMKHIEKRNTEWNSATRENSTTFESILKSPTVNAVFHQAREMHPDSPHPRRQSRFDNHHQQSYHSYRNDRSRDRSKSSHRSNSRDRSQNRGSRSNSQNWRSGSKDRRGHHRENRSRTRSNSRTDRSQDRSKEKRQEKRREEKERPKTPDKKNHCNCCACSPKNSKGQ